MRDVAEKSLPAVDDPPPMDESGEVDLSQIRYNLSLTPEERILQNDRWAEFVRQLREGGRAYYASRSTAP